MSVTSLNRLWKKIKPGHSAQIDVIHRTPQRHPQEAPLVQLSMNAPRLRVLKIYERRDQKTRSDSSTTDPRSSYFLCCRSRPITFQRVRRGLPAAQSARTALFRPSSPSPSYHASQPCIVCRLTPQSFATSVTMRPSAITASTALYLCSVTLISLMRGSVKHQPGRL